MVDTVHPRDFGRGSDPHKNKPPDQAGPRPEDNHRKDDDDDSTDVDTYPPWAKRLVRNIRAYTWIILALLGPIAAALLLLQTIWESITKLLNP